jgi:hemoglobin
MPRSRFGRLIRGLAIACLTAAAPLLAGTPAHAADTLYADLGGAPGIDAIVDRAFVLVLADDRIKDDFDNINLDRLRGRIKSQICELAGGPCHYPGRPMQAAHDGLDITQAKFNALAEDLRTAMAQQAIGYHTQNRLIALLAPMERAIVTK